MNLLSYMFKLDRVRQEEEEFEKIILSPEQKQNVVAMASLLATKLPIWELALRGFIWKAIKKYQIINREYMKDGERLTPEMKIQKTYEIAMEVRNNLVKILERSQDASIVDEALQEAMKLYKEKMAYR